MENVAPPKTIAELQAYLGLLNYYYRCLPNLSQELHLLYMLLRKESEFVWDAKCQKAFERSKRLLVINRVLKP